MKATRRMRVVCPKFLRPRRDIFVRWFVWGLLSEENAVLIVCIMAAR